MAIGIFIKRTSKKDGLAIVRHADLWGKREILKKADDGHKLIGGKYHWLGENDTETTSWARLKPKLPMYLFIPQDIQLKSEYEKCFKVTEILPVNVLGFQTHRDSFAIDIDRDALLKRMKDMYDTALSDDQLMERYDLKENEGGSYLSLGSRSEVIKRGQLNS